MGIAVVKEYRRVSFNRPNAIAVRVSYGYGLLQTRRPLQVRLSYKAGTAF